MDEKEIQIRATKEEILRFISSLLWQDMQLECEVWKEQAASEYDQADTMEKVARIQGRREAIDYLLKMPQTFLEILDERTGKITESNELDEEELC